MSGSRRRFGALEQRMDSGFAESRTEFRWLMGAMAGTALTVIVTILGALFGALYAADVL